MTLHQGACIITSGSATVGTAFRPLATGSLGRQEGDSLAEVFLYLVKDEVVLRLGRRRIRHVRSIEAVKGRIGIITGDQGHVLEVTRQIIISQAAQEEQLTLNLLVGVGELSVIGVPDLRQSEVALVDGVVPLTPYPPAYITGNGEIIIIERQVPDLRGVPDLITTGGINRITDTCV